MIDGVPSAGGQTLARMITLRRISVMGVLVVAALSSTAAVAAGGRADSGTIWASINHAQNGLQIISGDFQDKILGRGGIVYRIKAVAGTPGTVTATAKSVTIYTKNGSLTGTGSAVQTFNADGTSTVDHGKFSLTKGTAKLKGHSFVGTFSGVYDANHVFTFHYKGTYK
jgi:hypothetical protein